MPAASVQTAVQAPTLIGGCDAESHERIKWTAGWAELALLGVMPSGERGEPDLELRNCSCGTTLAKPIPATVADPHLVVDVTLDAMDALAVGENIRALARDKRTPRGVRDLFARVGKQLTAGARPVLVAAGRIR